MIKQLLFKFYVRFIRAHTSKAIAKQLKKTVPTNTTLWAIYKHLSMQEFSDKVNEYKYLPDPLNGAVDFTWDDPNMFFSALTYGRDCEDWAFVWSKWCDVHGYEPYTYIVTNKNNIAKDAHVICIAEKNDEVWCLDYKPYGPYNSHESALADMVNHWTKYTTENLIWEEHHAISG